MRPYPKKIIPALLSVALLLTVGCSKDYLDINNNPNQATSATPALVLPNALAASGDYVTTNFAFLNLWLGYWNWSGNYSINLSDKNYQFTTGFNNGIWNDAYSALTNYNYVDQQGATLNQPLARGMAKVMKALHFQYLVDTYGDVPYTDALKGTANFTPKYDNAVAIYEAQFKQLDSAITLLGQGKGTVSPGNNDIMFKSDVTKWVKLANTLKLRMLLRQSEKADRQAFVQAQLATVKAGPFLGAGENAAVNPGYENSQGRQNPFFGQFGRAVNDAPVENYNQFRANKYGVDFLSRTNDPRLGAFYAPVSGTTFGATNFGTIDVLTNASTSGIGPGLIRDVAQNSVILSSHEALFLQAEAVQRGWIAGDARTLYEAAITESFINLGLTAAQATAYYGQATNDVGWEASPNKLEAIITQKWVSLNGINPFEAWADYRRLGLPRVPISEDPSAAGRNIPVRLFYPQGEYDYNLGNVPAFVANSQFTNKIFWIK